MFYFQQLLNIALSGMDATSIVSTMINVAYGILLVGFLISLYQALMRGGDVRALGIAAIKYLVVAVIIAHWGTVFRDINNSFNSVAHLIDNSSGASDLFFSWMDQLSQQVNGTHGSFLEIITGDIASFVSALLLLIAYVIYAITIFFFYFFYALYGAVLYLFGPLVLALLPMAGVGDLAKSFATNLMIWNSWGIIYAAMGSLITAIHMRDLTQMGTGSLWGFLQGPVSGTLLGLVSVFFAMSIAVIPMIAKRIISGDVGASAMSLINAAVTAGGIAVAGVAGFAGAGAGAGAGSGASSAAGAGGSAGSTGGGSTGAAGATSSSAPRTPSAGQSIRAGLVSAVNGSSSPGSSTASDGEEADAIPPASSASESGNENKSSGNGAQGGSSRSGGSATYRPRGVAQTLTYQASRALRAKVAGKGDEED